MRLDRPRRTLAATAVVAVALTAGACGTSFNAQTNQQYQAAIGSDSRDTPVQVLGALLVTNEDGSATVSAALVNSTDTLQRLTGVALTAPDGTQLALDSTSTDDLEIAPGQSRTLGLVGDDAHGKPSVVFTTSDVEALGLYYTLTLTFSDAGTVEIRIPAVVRNSIYADVALPPGADPSENDKRPGQHTEEKRAEMDEHSGGGGH